MADYLAVIYIAGGSSHGRSPDKEKAINLALQYFNDWDSLFLLTERDLEIQVVNVDGYGQCFWDHRGMHGINEATGKEEDISPDRAEIVTRHFVPRKRRKRRA